MTRKKIVPPQGEALRKPAKEPLMEIEQRFRNLSESLPHLVWTCLSEGPCDYLSPQWIRYTGIPEEKQLGFGWLEQLHPDDRKSTIETWQSSVDAGNFFDIEFRIRRHDGVYRWFKTRAVPLKNSSGQIVKWYGSNTDIDDLKNSEKELREKSEELARANVRLIEDNFRRSLDESPLGVRIVTIDGETLYANRALLDIYAYDSVHELKKTPIKERYTPESFAEFQVRMEKRLRGEDVPTEYEISIVRKDGEIRRLQVFRKEVRWDGERQFQVIYNDVTARKRLEEELKQQRDYLKQMVRERTVELQTTNDQLRREITERKQAEEKIRALNKELQDRLQELAEAKALEEKANRAKAKFMANISHEFTTPLNSIIGFSQVLLGKNFGDLNEKQQGYVQNIFNSGHELHDTLNNIVSFVCMDVSNPDMNCEEFRLKDIAVSTLSVFRKAATDRHLTITLDMATEADRMIRADRGKLIQVFHTLLSNAVKFSGEGGGDNSPRPQSKKFGSLRQGRLCGNHGRGRGHRHQG